MSDFKKLEVWKKAHALALETHVAARRIRGAEYVSLRSQMIRAAISVAANIVEGREQSTDKEFARFLRYSVGSASELEYHLILAHDMHVIHEDSFNSLTNKVEQVRMMLHGLIGRLDPPKD